MRLYLWIGLAFVVYGTYRFWASGAPTTPADIMVAGLLFIVSYLGKRVDG